MLIEKYSYNKYERILENYTDEQALIYKNNYNLIVEYLKYKFSDISIQDIKDYASESLLKALDKINNFEGNIKNIFPWLKEIAKNYVLNVLRQNKKHNKIIDKDINDISIAQYEEDEDENEYVFNKKEMLKNIKLVIDELDPGYKKVFIMYYFDKMSHKEIAEKLNITEGTSKSQLFKAKNKIKELLKIKWIQF